MTPAQQLEYEIFLLNNPGDAHRASQALGFDTTGGPAQRWYKDNAKKLEEAGIPRAAAEDFIKRNKNQNGTFDYHRVFEALTPDYDDYPGSEEAPPEWADWKKAGLDLSHPNVQRALSLGMPIGVIRDFLERNSQGGHPDYQRLMSALDENAADLGLRWPTGSSGAGGGGGDGRGGGGGGGGVGGGGGGNSGMSSRMGMDGFGAGPEPYGETYSTLARPSWLQTPYSAPTWQGGDFVAPTKPAGLQTPYIAPTWQGGDFAPPAKPGVLQEPYALPTRAELEASPGYLSSEAAMQRGMERTAASRGSILSGGFAGRALPRAMGEYAGTAYGNLVNQGLTARQQNVGEYVGDVGRAFDQYRQKYGQFLDSANLDLQGRQQQSGEYQTDVGNARADYGQRYGQFTDAANLGLSARGVQEGEYQGDVANNRGQFLTRYNQYLDAAGLKRQAETDVWKRNMDLSDISLRAAALARPY